MAIVKVLTNQGQLIYEANTILFTLNTHGGVEEFEDTLHDAVLKAEELEEPLCGWEDKE